MALHLFIVGAIRCYETHILNETPMYAKKVKPIKRILSDRFQIPSLVTVWELAKACYYVVDDQAPNELHNMKACLDRPLTLGATGNLLDYLEAVYPPDIQKRAVTINKSQTNKSFFQYIIPELARYATKLDDLRNDAEEVAFAASQASLLDNCSAAIASVIAGLDPILKQIFLLESLEQVDSTTRTYHISIRRYEDMSFSTSRKTISFDELEEYETTISYLLMTRGEDQLQAHLFPFLVIHNDRLYHYKRSRSKGYEYYSIADDRPFIYPSKRKFSRSAFQVANRAGHQALFWIEVLPSTNSDNGVRANTPSEGPSDFFGRKKQIATIMKEVVAIPNQNGIMFGVGGVGKTALMIELSRRLFFEPNRDALLFDNIVWVSAKNTYYNPTLDLVSERRRQVDSLDSVLSTVLEFFEFEDIEGYTLDDKKDLLLDLLHDRRVLLILDNFETFSESEKNAIVRFFEVDVKYFLRRRPQNCKVIITSREHIRCGFHPIPLTGLDVPAARQLMGSLYRSYKNAEREFSDDEKAKLYDITRGIPILIKHCFGQFYVYNKPFDSVISSLASAEPNRAVAFSFDEIFKLVEHDPCHVEIILLLELIGCPLMIRQIAEILARDESTIERALPLLNNFQCVKRTYHGRSEKYEINDEVRVMTRRLIQTQNELAYRIREKINKVFTIEKQMGYSTEEQGILGVFNGCLAEKQYFEAERFIRENMEKKQSTLLKYYYAKYLRDHKRDIQPAIDILEGIRETSNNHPSILRLLVSSYTELDIPNYSRAYSYVKQLESAAAHDDSLKLELAEFYCNWSTAIKVERDTYPQSIAERLRIQEYKEHADAAISWLKQIKGKTAKTQFLEAQCYFNKWDYETASRMIDMAISLADDPRTHGLTTTGGISSTRRGNSTQSKGSAAGEVAGSKAYAPTLGRHR